MVRRRTEILPAQGYPTKVIVKERHYRTISTDTAACMQRSPKLAQIQILAMAVFAFLIHSYALLVISKGVNYTNLLSKWRIPQSRGECEFNTCEHLDPHG